MLWEKPVCVFWGSKKRSQIEKQLGFLWKRALGWTGKELRVVAAPGQLFVSIFTAHEGTEE